MNLLAIDNIYSTSSIPYNYKYIDGDEKDVMKENIEDQYINLNNLGINLLNQIDENEIKLEIINELLDFVNYNYTSIINFESVFVNDTNEIGDFIYQFFCIDCYSTLLPNYINQIKCFSNKEFEEILKIKFNGNQHLFKNSFILCIKSILDQMLKLSNLDKNIKYDTSYKNLIKKYSYYIDLLDFGTTDKFLYNYIIPLMNKHFDQILWRSN